MNKNSNYQQMAHRLIPGGAHTYSRGDDQYPSNAPPVLDHGKGAWVWDANGNKFLDYGMALRAVTIGYADERVAKAAIEQIYKGNNLTRPSVIEIEAAQKLCDVLKWPDQVKFTKNGSTATSAAIKLARAYTQKKKIARCLQHPFFSYDDWFIGDTPMNSGVPDETAKMTLHFNYNEIESLEKLFTENPNQIAAVILEPAVSAHPIKYADGSNFLQKIKQTCEKYSAVFILDEMITGFRWHIEGAAKYYDVTPDLACFGKSMANGFSVAALVGKKEIMELGGIAHKKERVFLVSTTHGAEMCGMGAFIETMRILAESDTVGKIWDYGKKLIEGTNAIARDLEIDKFVSLGGIPCSPILTALDQSGQVSFEFKTLLMQELVNKGVLMPWIALSESHGQDELDLTLRAMRFSLEIYKKALKSDVNQFLVGPPVKPVFRKYN